METEANNILQIILNVTIVVCTIINIAGCIYQHITYKYITKKRDEIKLIRDNIITVSHNVNSTAFDINKNLEYSRINTPNMPSQEIIDLAFKQENKENII